MRQAKWVVAAALGTALFAHTTAGRKQAPALEEKIRRDEPFSEEYRKILQKYRKQVKAESAKTNEHRDLLSEGEDFEGRVAAIPEEDMYGGEEREDGLEPELTVVTWRNVALARHRLPPASC